MRGVGKSFIPAKTSVLYTCYNDFTLFFCQTPASFAKRICITILDGKERMLFRSPRGTLRRVCPTRNELYDDAVVG